uniref:Uncharacterized protein n=1 Tax=Zooxanthella nutricula TaxID=1333877 RepID=A0A6V0IIT3_9DINO
MRQDDREQVIGDLQRQLHSERDKNRSLEDSYKFRVASFVKRELKTKNKIDALERRLHDGPDDDEHITRMDVIRNMHKSVVGGLECVQTNTAKILQEQEKDLMRAFRSRLQEVSQEQELQKSKKGEQSSKQTEELRKVVGSLHATQELAQQYHEQNKELQAEKARLAEKLKAREDDTNALYKELYSAKKEVSRLKALWKDEGGADDGAQGAGQAAVSEAASAPRRTSISKRQIEQARLQQTHNKQYEREIQYRETITKMKRMVESEKRTSHELKQQLTDLVQERSELEVLLRQCLEDVKAEILRHRAEAGSAPPSAAADGAVPGVVVPGQAIAAMSVSDLTSQDRERVLELLLSQQRVVQLLYNKTFTNQAHSHPPTAHGDLDVDARSVGSPSGKDGDFAHLSDIIPPPDETLANA